MPQIGPLEILVVGAIALMVFGPQKLPEIARSIGKALGELRRMASDVKSEFDSGLDTSDDAADASPRAPATTDEDDEG